MQHPEREPAAPAAGTRTAPPPPLPDPLAGEGPAAPEGPDEDGADESPLGSLRDEIGTLVEDARTYAAAEIAFQKTRARLAGRKAGRAAIYLVLALALLHLALIALAVGAVIALAPLVTIWGAIAIVVGAMLAGVVILLLRARAAGETLTALFDTGDTP